MLFPPSLQWRRVEWQASGSCGPSQGYPPRPRRNRHPVPGATATVSSSRSRGPATRDHQRGHRALKMAVSRGDVFPLASASEKSTGAGVYCVVMCLFPVTIAGLRQWLLSRTDACVSQGNLIGIILHTRIVPSTDLSQWLRVAGVSPGLRQWSFMGTGACVSHG